MSQSPIQFHGQEVGEALEILDEQRIEGINKSDLAREGLKQMIREVTTPEEKATIFSKFQGGEIEEEVARVFLGEKLDTMLADAEAARVAIEDDTSDFVE